MTGSVRFRFSALAAVVLAAPLLLGGCSVIDEVTGGPDVARDADTQEVTEAGTADVFSLKVGDCFETVDAEEVTEVPAIPCGDPHDDEIFHEFTMPDGEFPGQDALDAASEENCGPAFDRFVGLAYAESVLDWYPMQPTQGGWDELSDRLVQCVIYEPGVRVEGSLAGVAR